MPAMLPVAAGLLLVPALARLRRVPGPAPAIAGLTVAAHSAVFASGALGSGGRPRYFVTILPALAFAAAFGLRGMGRRVRTALFAGSAAIAVAVAAYRPNSWIGSEALARERGALTSSPTVKRLNGGRAIATWRSARAGTAIAWDSRYSPGGAFDSIPPDRLRLESEIQVPARWPWERAWTGRIYRLE
jgi:hypothetical protein